MNPALFFDVLFLLIACICAGFVVYGGWLSLGGGGIAAALVRGAPQRINPRSPAGGSFS